MKNISLLLILVLIGFVSCSKDEISDMNNYENGRNQANETNHPTLRSSTTEGFSNFSYVELDEFQPIYRFYGQNGHYYDLGKPNPEIQGTTKIIRNVPYNYEYQSFSVLKARRSNSTYLIRNYDSLQNRYVYSLGAEYSIYPLDAAIGYIYTSPQPGLVKLDVYQNKKTKKNLLVTLQNEVDWLKRTDPDWQFERTLGYVLQGERSEGTTNSRSYTVKNNAASKMKIYFVISGNSPLYKPNWMDPNRANAAFSYYFTLAPNEQKRFTMFENQFSYESISSINVFYPITDSNSIIFYDVFGSGYYRYESKWVPNKPIDISTSISGKIYNITFNPK